MEWHAADGSVISESDWQAAAAVVPTEAEASAGESVVAVDDQTSDAGDESAVGVDDVDVEPMVVSDTTDVVSDTLSDTGESDTGESDEPANENGDDD